MPAFYRKNRQIVAKLDDVLPKHNSSNSLYARMKEKMNYSIPNFSIPLRIGNISGIGHRKNHTEKLTLIYPFYWQSDMDVQVLTDWVDDFEDVIFSADQ